jgi:hypothetical protein
MTISTANSKFPIVEVIWQDAIEEGELGWNDPQETIAVAASECPVVHSVGYVIFESDSHISLIRSWHSDGLSSVEKIPKGFIREIRLL